MSENSAKNGKIYCLNCFNCKIVMDTSADGEPIKKVRCAAGHWTKKLGGEKLYRYVHILKRTQLECSDYEAMGDAKAHIKEIKKSLSRKDDSVHKD